MTPLLIILGILGVIGLWAIGSYNHFVRLINRVEEAWADIDIQLKRRHDLIPNLVNTVKGYAEHERELLEKVTQARAAAVSAEAAGDPAKSAQAENMLTSALRSVFAVSENYPELKANENFLELQREISDTENKIQAARRFYNTNVRDLNTDVDSFPSNVIAGMFKFKKREFFDLDDAQVEREPVAVNF